MINQLTLNNYRSYTERTFNFTEGINVLRGVSEAGKSTILEAIAYALFGTDALNETLADVVTYDTPVSKLKVAMDFTFNGVAYHIERSNAGAELTYGEEIVTGKRETRVFVERLLNCSVKMAKAIMIADQNAVRGVLDDGNTAAGGLVETLADLRIIDGIVDKIQTQLPSGNTKSMLEQLDVLRSLKIELQPPSRDAVEAAQNKLDRAVAQLLPLQAAVDVSTPKFVAAVDLLAQAAEAQKEAQRVKVRRVALKEQAEMPKPLSFTQEDVDQARLAASNVELAKAQHRAWNTKFPKCAHTWEGTLASLTDELAKKRAELKQIKATRTANREALIRTKAMRINDGICSLCDMDISTMPEVARKNAGIDSEVHRLSLAVEEDERQILELVEELLALEEVEGVTSRVCLMADTAYWDLPAGMLPPTPMWKGAEPLPIGEAPDVKDMVQQLKTYEFRVNRAELAQQTLDELEDVEIPDTAQAALDRDAYLEAEKAVKLADEQVRECRSALRDAESDYKVAAAVFERDQRKAEESMAMIDSMSATVADMEANNELIKKLRAARPEIASKLWSIVLGSITHYFTQIRCRPAVVTKDSDAFKVNGRPVSGLSGSTKDALGLAIRVALARVFLPSIPMLLVDEPFSGASADRELAGLGMLSSCGFEQVILVTHSELADSIATNMVALGD